MGYRSMFEVSIEYTEEYEKMAAGLNKSFFDYFFENSFEILEFFESSVDCLSREIFFYSSEKLKWYGFKEELLKISSIYTGCLIQCYVNGEDDEDFQEHYFKDGLHAYSAGKIMYWTNETEAKNRDQVFASNKATNVAMFYKGIDHSQAEE